MSQRPMLCLRFGCGCGDADLYIIETLQFSVYYMHDAAVVVLV